MGKKKTKAITPRSAQLANFVSTEAAHNSVRNTGLILPDDLALYIVMALLALVPILVHPVMVSFASPFWGQPYLSTGAHIDLGFFKFALLGAGVIFLVCIMLYKIAFDGFAVFPTYINLPSVLLVLTFLLACILAQYKSIALYGSWYRHEGMLTYLFYLMLLIVCANLRYTVQNYHRILYALTPLLLVNLMLSISSFYGYNLLSIHVFNWLFLGNTPYTQLQGTFNTTLENQNYMSGIGGTMTVIFLTLAVLTKALKGRVVWGVLALLSFSMVLTSLSTSGFLTIIVVFPVILILLFLAKDRQRGLITLGVCVLVCTAIFFTLNAHDGRIWSKDVGFFGTVTHSIFPGREANNTHVGQSQSGRPSGASAASAANSGNIFTLPPPGLGPGDGRIFIWRKTLALIKQKPWLGYGLDTLAYYFPQDDPQMGPQEGDYNVFIDKPHDIYLDVAFGGGLLSLLVFLLLLGRHLAANIKLFITHKVSGERGVFAAGLFVGWCAYLFQGLFNDSILSTGFIFWILFGVSVALVREEQSKPTLGKRILQK
ncbi:MAG: O-antigen ligase family protein [Peptococcaceae bacterium]|nr:O-antigen ligase family protein [Peptococcaceae bacterium]